MITFHLGTAYFNSVHGCGKCKAKGKQINGVRATVFTDLNAPARTDADFRTDSNYGKTSHHREKSPLLQLPRFDMVKDVIVADSLHLLDHGVTNRLLNGWIKGDLANVDAKWSCYQMQNMSKYLSTIKAPAEIRSNRPIRDLSCIAKWKGVEYRNFALYVGIVVLKGNLKEYLYNHFVLYFCAITIYSTSVHLNGFSVVAEKCIETFLERFKLIYGLQFFTSNIHNLIHVSDDIKRFGALNTISTYPFESKLYKIKRLLHTGNLPLEQVARRILESDSIVAQKPKNHKPLLTKICTSNIEALTRILNQKFDLFDAVQLPKLKIDCTRDEDQWILTKNLKVMQIQKFVNTVDGNIFIYAVPLKNTHDYFDLPIPSSDLYIYCVDSLEFDSPVLCSLDQIKCKLFKLKRDQNFVLEGSDKNEFVFIPVLSTFID